MKFCKNLQRVVEISDPEWAPYWINYKQLKKLIKGIISSSPSAQQGTTATTSGNDNDDDNAATAPSESGQNRDSQAESSTSNRPDDDDRAPAAAVAETAATGTGDHQSNGDETSERRQAVGQQSEDSQASAAAAAAAAAGPEQPQRPNDGSDVTANRLGSSPGEIAFFKLLHTEVKKASHFFEQAQKEYAIREERVRKGMELIKNERGDRPTGDAYYDKSFEEQWSRLVQSIFRLYRELLLLETFAIMNYCGFSKILKKHDKNTGFSTRNAFMAKVVNQANFTNYPQVLQMINRCERLYEEASTRLAQDGKQSLHEDERLFIHMIHRLNAQVVGVDDARNPDIVDPKGIVPAPSTPDQGKSSSKQGETTPSQAFQLSYTPFKKEAWKAQSLKELVAENDASLNGEAKPQNEDDDSDSDGEGDAKPKAKKKPCPDTVSSQNNDEGSRKRKATDTKSGDDDDDKDPKPDSEPKRQKDC